MRDIYTPFIDEKLTFNEHINNKINKANSVMGTRRANDYLDQYRFLLFKVLVRPHLEYANQIKYDLPF